MCHATWIHSYHFPGNNVEDVCPAFFQDIFKTFQTTLLGIPIQVCMRPNLLGSFRLALSWAFWVYWKVYWTEPFQSYFCNPSAICLRNFQTLSEICHEHSIQCFSNGVFQRKSPTGKCFHLHFSFLGTFYWLLNVYFALAMSSFLLCSPPPHISTESYQACRLMVMFGLWSMTNRIFFLHWMVKQVWFYF